MKKAIIAFVVLSSFCQALAAHLLEDEARTIEQEFLLYESTEPEGDPGIIFHTFLRKLTGRNERIVFEQQRQGPYYNERVLIENTKRDMLAHDVFGMTLLAYACLFDLTDSTSILLEKNCDMHRPLLINLDCTGGGIQRVLAIHSYTKTLTEILRSILAKPHLVHLVAYTGNVRLMRKLQQKGCDVNASNGCGRNPLEIACSLGHTALVAFLLSLPEIDVNQWKRFEESGIKSQLFGYSSWVQARVPPLFWTLYRGYEDIFKLMVSDQRFNKDIFRRSDIDLLRLAVQSGHFFIVCRLLTCLHRDIILKKVEALCQDKERIRKRIASSGHDSDEEEYAYRDPIGKGYSIASPYDIEVLLDFYLRWQECLRDEVMFMRGCLNDTSLIKAVWVGLGEAISSIVCITLPRFFPRAFKVDQSHTEFLWRFKLGSNDGFLARRFVKALDSFGYSALDYAAREGKAEYLKYFKPFYIYWMGKEKIKGDSDEQGIDIYKKDDRLLRAAGIAAQYGQIRVALNLLFFYDGREDLF